MPRSLSNGPTFRRIEEPDVIFVKKVSRPELEGFAEEKRSRAVLRGSFQNLLLGQRELQNKNFRETSCNTTGI